MKPQFRNLNLERQSPQLDTEAANLDEECDDPVPGRIYLDAAAFGALADGNGAYPISLSRL